MRLKEFLQERMRMSHIYQPVMIRALLRSNGEATRKKIAVEILKYDPSQNEYYEAIVDNMVGKVLRNHKIIVKIKDKYQLSQSADLDSKQVKELIKICDDKIDEYLAKRGEKVWDHRRKSRGSIPGTVRYEVLKRAKFRCELCGISADEKNLEVDHIVPKNTGGEDSISNYQALCYSCNAMKRDCDDEDFRKLKTFYSRRSEHCSFCKRDDLEIVSSNNLAIAFFDRYPVSKFHTLFTPLRHVEDYFEITQAEQNAIQQLLLSNKAAFEEKDSTIEGFNIGVNNGEAAGQTITHCHIHLIPRRKGDVKDPLGGIRNVFPEKGNYTDQVHY